MKKIILIIVVVLIIVVGGYFVFKGGSQKPSSVLESQQPSFQPSLQPSQQPENLVSAIKIANFVFNPADLVIKVGTTVTWTNNDSVPHQIKSDTFNSVALNQGGSFQFQFKTTGVYNYSCAIHPSMKGKITVEN